MSTPSGDKEKFFLANKVEKSVLLYYTKTVIFSQSSGLGEGEEMRFIRAQQRSQQ